MKHRKVLRVLSVRISSLIVTGSVVLFLEGATMTTAENVVMVEVGKVIARWLQLNSGGSGQMVMRCRRAAANSSEPNVMRGYDVIR